MPTIPRQFRLDTDTLALIDQLRSRLGLSSRAEVLRHAVARLAQIELPAPSRETGQKKNQKKNPD